MQLLDIGKHPLVARPHGCPVPLTAPQLGTWRSLTDGALTGARLAVASVRILGPLNTLLLRQCLDVLVQRHEPLRTRIISVDASPRQQIDIDCECHLGVVDLTSVSWKCAEREATRLVQEFIQQKVDFATGPLFEGKLLKFSSTEHVLALAIDHIVSDGVSCEILNRDLWTLYGQGAQGKPMSLPQLSVHFADYAVWQQRTYDAWVKHHGGYWRERLAHAPSSISLPRDDGLEKVNSSIATLHYPLGKGLTAQLREVAARERTRLSSVGLAVYVAAMSRWLHQPDLVLAFISHGRSLHPELENMVGILANHMILRIKLCEADSFVSLLSRINLELRSAYENFDFGRIPHLYPEIRSELVFNWLSIDWMVGAAQSRRVCVPEMTFRPFQVQTSWPVYFYPFFSETPSGVNITVVYRTDLFAKTTVDRFGNNMRRFASECGRDPLTAVASVTLAS